MIYQANKQDASLIAALALQMWDSHTPEELTDEFSELLEDERCAVFLCTCQEQVIGFAQCQLRSDYVEGTSSSPVGYLEGIFIQEPYRRQGFAGALLAQCETWAKEKGCLEFASDCELDNTTSLDFHLHAGFSEANRIICFTKKL